MKRITILSAQMICQLFFISSMHSALAQDIFPPSAMKPVVHARRAESKITIDGLLDEGAWKTADSLGDFTQIEPLQGEPAKNKTTVYNLRFAWEYKPLAYVYLVFNSQETLTGDVTINTEQQGIFKISYLKQF